MFFFKAVPNVFHSFPTFSPRLGSKVTTLLWFSYLTQMPLPQDLVLFIPLPGNFCSRPHFCLSSQGGLPWPSCHPLPPHHIERREGETCLTLVCFLSLRQRQAPSAIPNCLLSAWLILCLLLSPPHLSPLGRPAFCTAPQGAQLPYYFFDAAEIPILYK